MSKKVIFLSIVSGLIIFSFLIFLIDYKTTHNTSNKLLSNLDFKVWAHAGYYENSLFKPNTIESFQNAIENKARATELDVFYDENYKKFVVSHDFPYKENNNQVLFLDSVFVKFGNQFKYWLDFKNLQHLNENKTIESYKELDKLLKKTKVLKQNILVESQNLNNLSIYTKNGFYTSWWITPYKSRYRSIIRNYKYKLYFLMGKYSSLSMPYNYYTRVEKSMNNIPINIFTVNEKNDFDKFFRNKKVKIILTDKNWFDYK